jgi:RNA polymerase sigma factor (TIGR02999 family)
MTKSHPERVTELLRRWQGAKDPEAEHELFRIVQGDLERIARQTLRRMSGFDHKIEPAELVNEAYLSLHDFRIITENRRPFFKLMSRAMRHCLLDMARKDRAQKRPPSMFRVRDTGALNSVPTPADIEVFAFFDAVDALRAVNERQADTIEHRVLNGLTNQEIADLHTVALTTVKRDVREARAFLAFKLGLSPEWLQ